VKLYAEVLAELDAGRGVALATVIATSGSTPRHPGARMAITDDDRGLGTIGGGRIEAEVMAAGREVADGAMTVTAVAATAARPWRRPRVDGDVLREAVAPPDRAIVFGGGHVGRALGPVLRGLGFEVVLCDDGDTGALEPPPAWADRIVDSFDLADVERALGRLDEGDHVFIVTRDHAMDLRLLEGLLDRETGYLGMIGSRGKVGRFRKRLLGKGHDLRGWDRLRAPLGLDIGAETPEEIAIAIGAELVALRRRGVAAAGNWSPRPVVVDESARVGAVVLAAGAGRRLGGVAKALLPIDGEAFLARIVAVAVAAGVRPEDVVVVVGPPFADDVAAAARALGAGVVVNPAPERGMASSVALGFAAIAARPVQAALLWPVDHPRVSPATVQALVANGAGVPVHGGRGGHPALVPRALFGELAACANAAEGARGVLRGALARLDVVDPGVLADVDLPADLPVVR
jgi:xanthine/CO dehydrogenase XdhC/CoxF family maturation factor